MNRRRGFLAALGAAALTPPTLFGQSTSPVLIGWLHYGSRTSAARMLSAFKDAMSALGWREGTQFVLSEHWADGRADQLQARATELAAKMPAVIVAAPSQSVIAAAKAAPKIPVVQANGADPVRIGLATSLARPGGMVTGLSNVTSEVTEKYMELLLAAKPSLRRIGVLVDSTNASRPTIIEALHRSQVQLKIQARIIGADSAEALESALSKLARDRIEGLVVTAGPLLSYERQRIIKRAQQHRWPVIGFGREWPEEGALLSYFMDVAENYRRAAYYVDRILKGAKPGDLPVEQPTKFELVVNRNTAKALGIKISDSIMLRADKVIE